MLKPVDPDKIEIVMRAECPECGGKGGVPKLPETPADLICGPCSACGGSGRVTWGVPMRDFLEQVFGALALIQKERGQ